MNEGDRGSLPNLDGVLRTAQIIAAALVAGTSFFVLIAVFLRVNGKNGLLAANPWNVLPPEGLVSLIALFMGAIVLVASFAIPKSIVTAARRAKQKNQSSDAMTGGFTGIFLNEMIVSMALLEGGAFFNGVAFLLEGHIPNLIAALVLIFMIVARFPTRSTLDTFVENQEALLFEERQSA